MHSPDRNGRERLIAGHRRSPDGADVIHMFGPIGANSGTFDVAQES
jgi:hypothetical protein